MPRDPKNNDNNKNKSRPKQNKNTNNRIGHRRQPLTLVRRTHQVLSTPRAPLNVRSRQYSIKRPIIYAPHLNFTTPETKMPIFRDSDGNIITDENKIYPPLKRPNASIINFTVIPLTSQPPFMKKESTISSPPSPTLSPSSSPSPLMKARLSPTMHPPSESAFAAIPVTSQISPYYHQQRAISVANKWTGSGDNQRHDFINDQVNKGRRFSEGVNSASPNSINSSPSMSSSLQHRINSSTPVTNMTTTSQVIPPIEINHQQPAMSNQDHQPHHQYNNYHKLQHPDRNFIAASTITHSFDYDEAADAVKLGELAINQHMNQHGNAPASSSPTMVSSQATVTATSPTMAPSSSSSRRTLSNNTPKQPPQPPHIHYHQRQSFTNTATTPTKVGQKPKPSSVVEQHNMDILYQQQRMQQDLIDDDVRRGSGSSINRSVAQRRGSMGIEDGTNKHNTHGQAIFSGDEADNYRTGTHQSVKHSDELRNNDRARNNVAWGTRLGSQTLSNLQAPLQSIDNIDRITQQQQQQQNKAYSYEADRINQRVKQSLKKQQQQQQQSKFKLSSSSSSDVGELNLMKPPHVEGSMKPIDQVIFAEDSDLLQQFGEDSIDEKMAPVTYAGVTGQKRINQQDDTVKRENMKLDTTSTKDGTTTTTTASPISSKSMEDSKPLSYLRHLLNFDKAIQSYFTKPPIVASKNENNVIIDDKTDNKKSQFSLHTYTPILDTKQGTTSTIDNNIDNTDYQFQSPYNNVNDYNNTKTSPVNTFINQQQQQSVSPYKSTLRSNQLNTTIVHGNNPNMNRYKSMLNDEDKNDHELDQFLTPRLRNEREKMNHIQDVDAFFGFGTGEAVPASPLVASTTLFGGMRNNFINPVASTTKKSQISRAKSQMAEDSVINNNNYYGVRGLKDEAETGLQYIDDDYDADGVHALAKRVSAVNKSQSSRSQSIDQSNQNKIDLEQDPSQRDKKNKRKE